MEELFLWKQRYIHRLELEKGLSSNSIRAIQNDLKHFIERNSQEKWEGKISVYSLKSYLFLLQEEGFSPRTIQRKLSSLKGFLRFLKEVNLQEEDVSLYLTKWDTEPEEYHFLTQEEWKRFRALFQENVRDRAIFELLYSTGLKTKEFLSLSYLQIQWEKQEIYLLEKGKTRTVFFSQRAKEALWNYCQEEQIQEGFLWKLSEKTLRNIFSRYKEAGDFPKEMTISSLRHSFAIHLLEAGMTKLEVQYLLGLEQGERLLRYEFYAKKER